MAQKQFTYKVYSKSWTFKGILKDVMNDFVYSAQINSWQWDVEIDLKTNFGNTSYVQGDILKVYVSSDLYPSWLHLYTGIISKIKRTYQGWIEKITLVVLWLFSKLNDENHSLSFTNTDPSSMISSLVDSFNTLQSWYVSKWAIATYWWTQSITFDKKNYLSSLQDIAELTPTFWWYCDKLWQISYLPYWISNDFAILWNNVENISVEEDAEKIVNFVEVKTNVWVVSSQSNASIASYWRKAQYLTRTDFPDNASWLKFAQEYIAKYKDPVKKIRITLNDKFRFTLWSLWRSKSIWSESNIWWMQTRTAGIEELEPWMNISVRNIDYTLYNLQIQKIEYNQLKVVLDLSYFDSFTKEILW